MVGDFGGLFILALIWAFFKLVSRSREDSGTGQPMRRPTQGGLGRIEDPPREEGRALRMLLRELEGALNQGAGGPTSVGRGPVGRPAARRLPSAEEVEDREVLEVAPEVESLERDPGRAERAAVDQDDQAEQVIARRAASAASRAGGRTPADHQRFDQRIRQEPADHTATRALTQQQLRDAVVWREILGPPVSLREP
jgi:hypothetical protein